jgi:hypothetical protein
MLRTLSETVDPELWQSLGSPDTLKTAMRDRKKRWHRFIRSGEYQSKLSNDAIVLIDDYRRRTKTMLLICAAAGLLLLFRFWPLLKPEFL